MGEASLIFHLGMPKTGTSILQNSIVQVLAEPGAEHLVYPELERGRRGIAHHSMARRLLVGESDCNQRLAAELLDEITTVSADRQHRTISVCSSESFIGLCGIDGVKNLHEFMSFFPDELNTRAFIVIRELADFLESMYLQSTRFGNLSISFNDYLKSREKWAENLLKGILQLKLWQHDRLSIAFQNGDFNIIDYCEPMFDLPRNLLQKASLAAPSTEKISLKAQVVRSHLDRVQAEVGFTINRKKLYHLLSSEAFFDDDVLRYTLYTREERRRVYDHYMDIARDLGFSAYTTAFQEYRRKDLPVYDMKFNILSTDDLQKISDHAVDLQP